MADTTEENAVDSELQKIHSSVKKIKRNKQIGGKYMIAQQAMIDLQMEMQQMRQEFQEEKQQSYQDGISNGEKRNARLTAILLKEEKFDELKRSAEDETYRNELYKKYEL